MQKRKIDELISHFNRKVADMDIDRKYKMELLGMITAILQRHDEDMKHAPTIESKTGKWTPKENRPKQEVFICSECGGWAYSPWIGSRKTPKPNKCKYSYCPNCGARMSE